MKPFVAIGGGLDYLFAKYFGSVSVEKCAQTENLCCRLEAVLGPAGWISWYFVTLHLFIESVHEGHSSLFRFVDSILSCQIQFLRFYEIITIILCEVARNQVSSHRPRSTSNVGNHRIT